MTNIDFTINIFESVLARLNQSFVKIVDYKEKMYIGVINPSVNDFLRPVILENELETQAIIKSATYYKQLKRCSYSIDICQILDNMFDNGSILNIDFESDIVRKYFITSYICMKKKLDSKYQNIINQYFLNVFGYKVDREKFLPPLLSNEMILNILLRDPFHDFYHIKNIFNEHLKKEFFDRLELNELVSTINIIDDYFNGNKNETYYNICNIVLNESIEKYILNISISEYCENYPIEKLLSKDKITIHNTVKNWIYEDINNKILFMLDKLKNEKLKNITIPEIDIDTSEIYNVIDSYLEPDINKEDNFITQIEQEDNFEFDIENIFER